MSGDALDFGEDELKGVAGSYDKSLHEAPIVIGHPAGDAPAYGWVEGLDFSDGALVATPDQVDPAFADMVRDGRFKKVSASFYLPGAESNPVPGSYYLRHVGFLGAQPPAVKGLKAVQFGENEDGVVTIEFGEVSGWTISRLVRRLREFFIDEFGLEKADQALPDWQVDDLQDQAAKDDAGAAFIEETLPNGKEPEMADDDDTAAKAAKLDEREKALAEKEDAQTQKETAFAETKRREEAAAFIEGLAAGGKVLPAEKGGLARFMSALDDDEAIQFGEDDEARKTPLAFFKAHLESLPKRVDFAERSAEEGGGVDAADPEAVANEAVAYQEGMKAKGVTVSADKGVRHVLAEARK